MGRQSDDLSIVVEANRYELIKIADLVCLSFFYHLFIFFYIVFSCLLLVYLRTSPQIALERVKQRKRVEEKEVTLEQLERCHDLYENWIMTHNCQFPVAVVDANADAQQVNTAVASLLHSVFKISPSTPC